jgi:hypothetical protein
MRTASRASSRPGLRSAALSVAALQRVLADRRRPLYAALLRHGGPQHWAQELGVAFIARHPGPQRSEADVRASLRALFREHRFKRFPFERWLREHGPRGLVEQIRRSGGARRWARELGVPGPQPGEVDG